MRYALEEDSNEEDRVPSVSEREPLNAADPDELISGLCEGRRYLVFGRRE